MNIKLETKVIIGSFVALLLILLLTYTTYYNRYKYMDSHELIMRTYEIKQVLLSLEANLYKSEDLFHHKLNNDYNAAVYAKSLNELDSGISALQKYFKSPAPLKLLDRFNKLNQKRIGLNKENRAGKNSFFRVNSSVADVSAVDASAADASAADYPGLNLTVERRKLIDSLSSVLTLIKAKAESKLLSRKTIYNKAVERTGKSLYILVGTVLAVITGFFFLILIDIKKRNKAEADIAESERLLKAMFNESADALFLVGEHSHVIEKCNDSSVRLFEMDSPEELTGKFGPRMHKDEWDAEEIKKVEDAVNKNGIWESEIEYITKTGRVFWGAISVKSLNMFGKPYKLTRIIDITQRKNSEMAMKQYAAELEESKAKLERLTSMVLKANNELKLSRAELKELNDSKDKFFSILAHDLKSPFSGILGVSEYLDTSLDSLKMEEIKEYASALHQASKKIYGLLINLLEWSRLQAGIMPYCPKQIAVFELVDEAIRQLSINATNKGINLRNKVSKDAYVFADEKMISTVIRNLLSNAIKFTNSGGQIAVTSQRNAGNLQLCVIDSGLGMSSETIDKIFRIDSNYSTRGTFGEEGSGLGLVLCKDLIEKNNGSIWIKSEVSKGSEIYFILPETGEKEL